MTESDPRLHADDHGVWREDDSGQRFGLAWDEIEWVRCCFQDGPQGGTAVSVALYTENGGIGLELGEPHRERDGHFLAEVAAAIAAHCRPGGTPTCSI